MKLIAKITVAAAIAGAGATMYAAPGDVSGYEAMNARAMTIRTQTQADYRHVLQLQTVARREKDVIKLNCVNDKLVQIKAQMNVEDRLQLDLQVNAQAGDPVGTLQTMTQTADQIRRLRESAEQCIGEHLLVTESSSEYAHPDIPDNPGVNPWGGDNLTIEPPAYASPVN